MTRSEAEAIVGLLGEPMSDQAKLTVNELIEKPDAPENDEHLRELQKFMQASPVQLPAVKRASKRAPQGSP